MDLQTSRELNVDIFAEEHAHTPTEVEKAADPERISGVQELASAPSISELPCHSQRVGGFQVHELLSSVPPATAVASAILLSTKRLMSSCGHFCCASCLGQRDLSEGFSCPGLCRNWICYVPLLISAKRILLEERGLRD